MQEKGKGVEIITSNQNARIKEIQKLKEHKHREKSSKFLVEGTKNVLELVNSNYLIMIEEVYISEKYLEEKNEERIERKNEILAKVEAKGKLVIQVSEPIFKKITQDTTPEGIIAKVKYTKERKKEEIIEKAEEKQKQKETKIIYLFEKITDPGNMGTILRTAVALGVNKIYVGDKSVDIFNHKVIRASMGAVFKIEVDYVVPAVFLKNYKKDRIYIADMQGEDLYKISKEEIWGLSEKTESGDIPIIVFGNEATGISKEILSVNPKVISIPMVKTESLNLSSAFNIIGYEMYRKLNY